MTTKAEIIEETANYYNLTNRGYDAEFGCLYVTREGNKCAVGRCLNQLGENLAIDIEGSVYTFIEWLKGTDKNFEDLLLEQYKGHKVEFWSDLQKFHDEKFNFNETGLSIWGIREKDNLLNKWSDS